MRVTTAFDRMLRLPGASVIDVSFSAEGVIVTVRLRRRRRVCSGCGQVGGHLHGHRIKRWRHLDLGANRCVIECQLRRLWRRDVALSPPASVADHAAGSIVWCAPGRNAQTLQAFFDLLGERKASIRAVSIDMAGGYQQAISENLPEAEIAFDPFHVVAPRATRGRPGPAR